MCGIAGFVALPQCGRSTKALSVLETLKHRGPDDYGWLRATAMQVESGRKWLSGQQEPEVLLLHRRLSIIDTSEGGWQPMSTADGRHHLVYNGEIYNYLELREELEQEGHRFHSDSDTEVLLAAYAAWGLAALPRLVGMFAFALLDTTSRTLLLARDFFGIKPLYFWSQDGCLCFGSEIKALSAFGLSCPHADATRLLLYLRSGVTDFGSGTMLQEVMQVPAAHYVVVPLDTAEAQTPQRYWSLSHGEELEISFEAAACEVRDLFLRSMQLHLRSDVPVGAALSGGIDSSSIVMAIRHLDSKAEVHAFSFIPDDTGQSEERWVDIVVSEAKAQVHKVHALPGDLVTDLDLMIELHDEPFGSTSAYAQYLVFRAARSAGIKVMLDGQGADEILGGYHPYKGARLASLLRQGSLSEAAHYLRHLPSQDGMSRSLGLAYCADFMIPPSLQAFARSVIGKEVFPSWLNRPWFAERHAGMGFINYTQSQDVLRETLSRSVTETLPGLLRYEDRNSMASSVESRVPFLTPELVNFLGRLPERFLIDEQGTSKAVFRQAMRGLVPDSILDRRDKVGFATPERWWMNQLHAWVCAALESDTAKHLPFLNLESARRELEGVRQGKRPFGTHLWRWVNLIRWTEKLGVIYN